MDYHSFERYIEQVRDVNSFYNFYTYRVELVGADVRITAQSQDKTEEPVGKFRLEEVQPQVIRLTGKARRGTASLNELRRLGELLFWALFDDRIATHFREWLRKTVSRDLEHETFLRLELDFDEATWPDVAALPWEALRSPQQKDRPSINLATHPHLVIARRRKLWESTEAFKIGERLRIQLVIANPRDLPDVQYEMIWQSLQSLAKNRTGLIEILAPVVGLNLIKLDQALENKPHILHFIGHGRIKRAKKIDKGQLALVNSTGYANWISDAKFARRFELHQPLLVFVQACESNAIGTKIPFVGVASNLIHQNIPVVIGMQFPVSNVVAVSFATTFYTELIENVKPIEVAIQEGRRKLEIEFGETANILTPVLSSRLKPGPLFLISDDFDVSIDYKFSDSIVKDYPYPIAHSCDYFNKISQPVAKFLRLNNVIVNTIKYLCAIALAHRHFEMEDVGLFRRQLGTLSHPTLDAWVRLLGLMVDSWKTQPSIVADLLSKFYATPIRTDSPITSAQRLLQKSYKGSKPDHNGHLTIRDFVETLVEFREVNWADNIDHIDEEFAAQLLPALQPAVASILNFLSPLVEYPLCFIERIDMEGMYWIYTMIEFQGCSEKPIMSEYRDVGVLGQPSVTPRRLYLCAPDKQPILDLSPFIVYIAADKNALYFLDYNDKNEDINYLPCGNGKSYKPSSRFTTFMISVFNLENGDNPFDSIDQAISELDEINQLSEFDAPTLSALLKNLDNESWQVVINALGESLRIGRSWLGIEFLLMALSRPESGSLLSGLLHEIDLSASEFRGTLRGMVGVVTRDDWRQIDSQTLGANAYAILQDINLEALKKSYRPDDVVNPMVTPRMKTILREAFNSKRGDKIQLNHLLLASLAHRQCIAIQFLLRVAHEAGWELDQVFSWIGDPEMQDAKVGINRDQLISHKLTIQRKRQRRSKLILEVLNGPLDGAFFTFTSGIEWGAKVDGPLVFPWDLELGAKQARFFYQQNLWWIESFPARHSTYRIANAKRERITGKTPLNDKDVLKASNSWFLVHLE